MRFGASTPSRVQIPPPPPPGAHPRLGGTSDRRQATTAGVCAGPRSADEQRGDELPVATQVEAALAELPGPDDRDATACLAPQRVGAPEARSDSWGEALVRKRGRHRGALRRG